MNVNPNNFGSKFLYRINYRHFYEREVCDLGGSNYFVAVIDSREFLSSNLKAADWFQI